jgi:tetratricopeptide (TPR) repeat protein
MRLVGIGRQMFDADQYAAAREIFTAATELGLESPEVLFKAGYCCAALGDDASAADWYEKCAAACAKHAEEATKLLPKLYNNYGVSLVALKKYDEALRAYEKAAQADEKYAAVQFNLGRLYAEHLKDPVKAAEHYRRHIALGGSRSVAAREALGKLLKAQEEKPAGTPPANP